MCLLLKRLCVLGVVWGLCALGAAGPVQAADEIHESVLRVALPGRSMAALVTHLREHADWRRAILLMPGAPGIMQLRSVDDYTLKGNFLIRSRHHWLDPQTVVFSVDAPSDQWDGFSGAFRASERYAEDIRGLVEGIRQQYGALSLVVVGTSEGSVSAYHAARALPRQQTRVIFTNSLFLSSPRTAGLGTLDFGAYDRPMLWVHHADDPCRYTPYAEAQRLARLSGASLITVRSRAAGSGPACQARTQHGFIGAEQATVQAMRTWLDDGVAHDVTVP